jgi:hypothetical protein
MLDALNPESVQGEGSRSEPAARSLLTDMPLPGSACTGLGSFLLTSGRLFRQTSLPTWA